MIDLQCVRTCVKSAVAVLVVLAGLSSAPFGHAQAPYSPGDEVEITAQLQAGESVRLAAGEYRFERGWRLARTVTIAGVGRDLTILQFAQPASADGAAVEWQGAGTLEISDLAIRLADTASMGDVLRASAGSVQLTNVEVSGGVANSRRDQALGTGLRFVNTSEGLVRDSVVTHNAGWGLVATGSSTLHLEDTELSRNAGGGAWLGEHASMAVVASRIIGNDTAAVLAIGWAWLSLFGSTLSDNAGPGIDVRSYAESLVVDSRILRNQGGGFSAHDQAWSTLSGNHFETNGGIGVSVWNSARVAMVRNTIASSTQHGLLAAEEAVVTVLGNVITANGGTGVVLTGSAGGSVTQNLIERNEGGGVVCENRAAAVVNHNSISDNAYAAYRQDDSARCGVLPDAT